MGMFDFITKPIKFIIKVVQFLVCLVDYVKKVFSWSGKTIKVLIIAMLSLPFCMFFYIFHLIWIFLQFIIIDIIFTIILLPSTKLGVAVGFPLPFKYDSKRKKHLRKLTDMTNIYSRVAPKIMSKCYKYKISKFPEWDLTIPKFK
jgi:hypothetical protein